MMRTIISVVVLLCCVGHLGAQAARKQKCTKVVDIVMVLDESGSIGAANFEKIKQFVNDIISRFSVAPFGAHFAAVKYSWNPNQVFSLTKYTNAAQLHTAVQNMNYQRGGTFTGKALEFVRIHIFGQNEDRKGVPNVLVLFSDGESSDHAQAVTAAQELKNTGVEILCVGLGQGNTAQNLMDQLKQLASKPEYLFQTAMGAMNTIENSLVKDMCEAAGCAGVSYAKQGCYEKPGKKARTSKVLFNVRDRINWGEGWDLYLENVVCDCAKAAKDRGYRFFGIQYYGECWGYNDFDVSSPHAGAGKCWGIRPDYAKCKDKQKKANCVGTADHGYIYKFN